MNKLPVPGSTYAYASDIKKPVTNNKTGIIVNGFNSFLFFYLCNISCGNFMIIGIAESTLLEIIYSFQNVNECINLKDTWDQTYIDMIIKDH